MARKSRKETAAVAVQEADAPCRAAIYVRLSVEDTHTHSVSIETQQMIIARYLEQYPEISVYDTYIDNGATGTNFHRPGFQQMLSDIEAGHVNCVIVKDLSRLGRNTIDTGYYIEQYFRIRSIRFIAVNENFDTAAPEDAHSGIIIPLRNMINEAYALDIGRKIRAQQRQAMKDGKFIGATEEIDQLNADLDQVLVDYRRDYDDETTTEFANLVEVVTGNASGTDLITADEVMALADGKFSISLSTDIVYTRDVAYDTKVKYDEDKSSSYKKVTTKGVKGEEEVTVRTTFVDGVQTDAVQTDAKTLKEAVDEVVVKGKAEDTSSSTGSSSTSSNSSSSSSSNSSSSYTTGSSGMFAWPLPYTHTLTSTFGTRWGRLHGGLDISAGGVYGQPIYASASGTVTFSGGDNSGYGNYVIIDHGSGYTTLYGHCSSLVAVTGQYVNQGDLIGYVGSTGNSTGPHLHFEIRLNGEKMDPLGYTS